MAKQKAFYLLGFDWIVKNGLYMPGGWRGGVKKGRAWWCKVILEVEQVLTFFILNKLHQWIIQNIPKKAYKNVNILFIGC